jgi:hypothetical protein
VFKEKQPGNGRVVNRKKSDIDRDEANLLISYFIALRGALVLAAGNCRLIYKATELVARVVRRQYTARDLDPPNMTQWQVSSVGPSCRQ